MHPAARASYREAAAPNLRAKQSRSPHSLVCELLLKLLQNEADIRSSLCCRDNPRCVFFLAESKQEEIVQLSLTEVPVSSRRPRRQVPNLNAVNSADLYEKGGGHSLWITR